MTRTALVIGHHPGEHAGSLTAPLRAFGFAVHTWIPSEGPAPVDGDAVDALVVLGGIMGANDEAEHPWLADELRLVERRVAAATPILGVCLGGQILARVLGARVYRAPAQEVGFPPLELTDETPTLAHFAANGWRVLQWHQDAFELPAGARRLARTALTPNQAFEYGSALALQCHPEAELATVRRWVAHGAESLAAGGHDADAFLAEAERWCPGMETAGAAMMETWLGQHFERPAAVAAG